MEKIINLIKHWIRWLFALILIISLIIPIFAQQVDEDDFDTLIYNLTNQISGHPSYENVLSVGILN